LKDFVNEGTAKIVHDWRQLVFNAETGLGSLAVNIKVDATLELFAPDGSFVRKWGLYGVWPSGADYGNGDMEATAVNLITVTLQIDYYKAIALAPGA